MSSAGLYRAFEERFRGPREVIRMRLQAYRPFVEPLQKVYRPAYAIDLGCGRGEWLELVRDRGFEPHGVDLDEGMLAACIERGLHVSHCDAIAHLKELHDASQCVVSGFHVAEHVSFETLDALVGQALRVLKPGGLLILETPNPENLVVGTCNFYLDPTHRRPIPPQQMSFLPEYHGFARTCVVRLQEDKTLRRRTDIGLLDVLGGVSRDYAVVAQKAAPPEMLREFDTAFAARRGIELGELASRYDARLEGVSQRLANLEARLADAAVQEQLQARIEALQQSWSWRITAPLRRVAGMSNPLRSARAGVNHVIRRGIDIVQVPLAYVMAATLRCPQLSERINRWLMRFPPLHQQLLEIAYRRDVIAGDSGQGDPELQIPPRQEALSPRARQIHRQLRDALANREGPR